MVRPPGSRAGGDLSPTRKYGIFVAFEERNDGMFAQKGAAFSAGTMVDCQSKVPFASGGDGTAVLRMQPNSFALVEG
jgi:hypothetical protein